MIANFFKKSKPIHAIFISMLFLVYYVMAILFVEKPIFSGVLVAKKISYLGYFLVLFFLVQFINRKNQLSDLNSYTILILAFLFGIFPKTMEIHPIFYAHLFLLLAYRRIYSLKTNKDVKQKLFDSAFWIGIATLFFNWSVLFFIVVYVTVVFEKKQRIRNILIPIVGFFTPLFIAFTYYFITDNSLELYKNLTFNSNFSFDNLILLESLVLITFLTLGIFFISYKINSLKNDLKKSWILIIIHFLVAICIMFINPQKNNSEILLLYFPAVIISGNFMQLIDKTVIIDIVILGFLIMSLTSYFS